MADRTDFHFRQKVTEAELDLAFELLEKADRNLAADLGIYGIISGRVALLSRRAAHSSGSAPPAPTFEAGRFARTPKRSSHPPR